ncbi:MAG: hypothetical protein AAF717_00165 [Bacteroidota bacterium]
MDKAAVWKRIDVLRDALAWSLEHNRLLTWGQRVYINMERSAWQRELDWNKINPDYVMKANYIVPGEIESKIRQISALIKSSGYDRSNYERQYINQWS